MLHKANSQFLSRNTHQNAQDKKKQNKVSCELTCLIKYLQYLQETNVTHCSLPGLPSSGNF